MARETLCKNPKCGQWHDPMKPCPTQDARAPIVEVTICPPVRPKLPKRKAKKAIRSAVKAAAAGKRHTPETVEAVASAVADKLAVLEAKEARRQIRQRAKMQRYRANLKKRKETG
jgi:hypothetical protein